MSSVIRIFLPGSLIYFVWKETGYATAVAIGLIFIGQEATNYVLNQLKEKQ